MLITVVGLVCQMGQWVELYFKLKLAVANLGSNLWSTGEVCEDVVLSVSLGLGRTSYLWSFSPFGQRSNVLPL